MSGPELWRPGEVYHITLTIERAETRAERRERERLDRLDKFLTGLFVLFAAAILVLVTVALCHTI